MRLLFIIDSLGSGGAQRQMVNLALGLHQRGHEVEFFLYYPQDLLAAPLRDAGIAIHFTPKSSRHSLAPIKALRQRIGAGAYDLLLSFLATPSLYAELARWPRKRPRLVVSERFCDPASRTAWRSRILRQFHRLADYVTTNSHHQRKRLLESHPWLRNKVATVYNGVDLSAFHPPEAEPAGQSFRLLAIGSVSPYKNGLCLVEALAILRSEYNLRPQVSWVGKHVQTIQERCTYLRRMQQALVDHNLGEQWTWLHEQADIPTLLRQHHALVHPSYWEGVPNVVCEALACGRPVILSDVLDHSRLVEDGLTGYLFDWRNPRALADVIRKLHALSPADRQAMGRKGRQFAEQQFTLSRLTNEYEHLFRSIVAQA